MNDNLPVTKENRTQRRYFKRVRVDLPGRLFVPSESREAACTVDDLSPGGAAIACEAGAARDTPVILYVNGFGRFEGRVARQEGSVVGIRFDCGELKRERVAEQLNDLSGKAPADASMLRRHKREAAAGSAHFTRADGQMVPCRVLDLSPGGVNVKTEVRPPLGEFILIGQMAGRVVRHHESGVGIEFVGGPASARGGAS